MGCLLVTAIAAALFYYGFIGTNAFLFIAVGSIAWIFIGSGLYFKFGFLKFFYHGFLHWHTPDESKRGFDGCSLHAVCKHCGKNIMLDSQGNWFTFGEDG